MESSIETLANHISIDDTVVAFTGAGVSSASGVPTFRGEDGIWNRLDSRDFSRGALESDPARFWDAWIHLHEAFEDADAAPNEAHEGLARLFRDDVVSAIVTQNIDGLHQAGGAPDSAVVELHGNARTASCRECGRTEPADETMVRVQNGEIPPRCGDCDGDLHPDAVLFGEPLPPEAIRRARQLAADSDQFLVIGSSLTVQPAASLPVLAMEKGGTLVIDNLDATPLDDLADYRFEAPAEEFVPALERVLRRSE